MKTLIIGGSGTIGRAITQELKEDTDIVTASRSSGDYHVDLGNEDSIKNLFEQTGKLDAIICAAATGIVFKPLSEICVEDYRQSLQQKVFGQIAVALHGIKCLNDHGNITLTSGIMSYDFIKNGTAPAVTHNAVEGFVQSAALDLPRSIRINAVSPALLEESVENYKSFLPGFEPVSSKKVGRAYRKSIYGIQTGRVYRVL